ncbi:MAG: 50S ribosomal protein L25 [Eubacteriales bacterium]
METIKIEKRTNTNSNANMRLRRTGYLPGSVYGKGIETMTVSVKCDEMKKILAKYGRNVVLNLEIPSEKPITVIIKEIQHAPLNREFLHVDFKKVSLSEEIHTEVAIRILGVEVLDAKKMILVRHTEAVSVKGLPQDIPDMVEVNVSNLQAGESLSIHDIKLPKNVVIENDLEQVLVSVTEPRVHEEKDENDNINEEEVEIN